MEVDDPVYSFSEVLRHMDPPKVFCGGREKGASHMTICNLIHHQLEGGIEEIFPEISQCRFEKEAADLEHIDIDGTRATASASRYSWVWRESCETDWRKVSGLLMNCFGIKRRGVKFGVREAYAIEYLEYISGQYAELVALEPEKRFEDAAAARARPSGFNLRQFHLRPLVRPAAA